MQHLDTDIDLALDDPETELVYETTGWGRLVHSSCTAFMAPVVLAVVAELTGQPGLLTVAYIAAGLLFVVAVLALVMEYRADHRTTEIGGHGE